MGILGTGAETLMIDQCILTNNIMTERRPDLIAKSQKCGLIFEVACAWEPFVQKREKEKEEIPRAGGRPWPGFKVRVIPVVIGDLGTVVGLRESLKSSGILKPSWSNKSKERHYAAQ